MQQYIPGVQTFMLFSYCEYKSLKKLYTFCLSQRCLAYQIKYLDHCSLFLVKVAIKLFNSLSGVIYCIAVLLENLFRQCSSEAGYFFLIILHPVMLAVQSRSCSAIKHYSAKDLVRPFSLHNTLLQVCFSMDTESIDTGIFRMAPVALYSQFHKLISRKIFTLYRESLNRISILTVGEVSKKNTFFLCFFL